MKAKLSEILLTALGTLLFSLFVLPVFMIWIPSRILSLSEPMEMKALNWRQAMATWLPVASV